MEIKYQDLPESAKMEIEQYTPYDGDRFFMEPFSGKPKIARPGRAGDFIRKGYYEIVK